MICRRNFRQTSSSCPRDMSYEKENVGGVTSPCAEGILDNLFPEPPKVLAFCDCGHIKRIFNITEHSSLENH